MASGGLGVGLKHECSLIERGEEVFADRVQKYERSLLEVKRKVDDIINDRRSYPPITVIRELKVQSGTYSDIYTKYCEYLDSVRTDKGENVKRDAHNV